jgi:hypothetical protein
MSVLLEAALRLVEQQYHAETLFLPSQEHNNAHLVVSGAVVEGHRDQGRNWRGQYTPANLAQQQGASRRDIGHLPSPCLNPQNAAAYALAAQVEPTAGQTTHPCWYVDSGAAFSCKVFESGSWSCKLLPRRVSVWLTKPLCLSLSAPSLSLHHGRSCVSLCTHFSIGIPTQKTHHVEAGSSQ